MEEPKYRYPGTRPFTISDKEIFHGRRKNAERLYDLLKSKNLVVLHSESGMGKSSLINAGLIPLFTEKFEDDNFLPVRIRFYNSDNDVNLHYNHEPDLLVRKILSQLQPLKTGLAVTKLPFVPEEHTGLWQEMKLFEKNE